MLPGLEGLSPEFSSEIALLQTRRREAMAVTGLLSSAGLCHQINLAIAYKLSRTFSLPMVGFSPGILNRDTRPMVAYVYDGQVKLGEGRRGRFYHSYPIIFGMSKHPLLIDGANDQVDVSNPFLVSSLDPFYQRLRELRHIGGKYSAQLLTDNRIILEYERQALRSALERSVITQPEYDESIKFTEILSKVELAFLLGFSRKWLKYFIEAFGIDFPYSPAFFRIAHVAYRRRTAGLKGNPRLLVDSARQIELDLLADRLIPD